ncbi:MAG: RHS repeat-associated core domain-containing protein [Bacteroidales bacterium]|nr:RHS repeat-associated core domain-containing protein [Bacteroidales bacterium]
MQYNDKTYWKYEYNLSDHLGNVRIVFAAHSHGQPELMQQTIYYPYGMTLHQQNFGGTLDQPNKMLYNGKELQDDQLAGMSLDWYDYGARFYDPQIGRWHVVDPHAENYYSWSPYHYASNNPIIMIDPNGKDWYQAVDDEGNIVQGGAVMWIEGSDDIDGYSNIGASYTMDLGDGVSMTYNQNTPVSLTETVLSEGDWSSQIQSPELGDCFRHCGIIVRSSGAESHNTTDYNITNIWEGINYLDEQINQEQSARVHVDRIMTETGQGSNRGRHWVAISSRTTNLQTGQTTSFGFYDPGTRRREAGTSPHNQLNIGGEGTTLTGQTQYSNRFTYRVTAIRRNK